MSRKIRLKIPHPIFRVRGCEHCADSSSLCALTSDLQGKDYDLLESIGIYTSILRAYLG